MAGLLTAPVRHRARFHELTVSRVERLTDQAVALSFAVPVDLAKEYAFEPGQHLTLRATIDGAEVRRSYSICLSRRQASRRRELRVASATVDGGAMSTWLNSAVAVGDRLQVMTPLGGFTCPTSPSQARHHVFFAGGSGITPTLSLLSTVLEEEPLSSVTLVYGNRRTDTVMFLEELQDLKDTFPTRLQLVHVLSREAQESELLSGRLDRDRVSRLVATLAPVDAVDEWYACGPQGMVEGVQAELAERGVEGHHVHHEVFHVVDQESPRPVPLPPPGAVPEATVTVTLDGRRTVVEMPSREETILAATLRSRPDAPYSCTGGVCGTCRARVVEGQVRMDRNYALEPEELAAGIVLACQSHPVTDTVTLDYDA
ncbi:MAG TPA: 1,2-phenylacetyl-CoA epoxidase subunit PaaE [Dermatophilaceae bacterium]|nr:1,2-phenylacetyl-CoA epoxidase subunit PaaE [Dermatophilaceae bacterium]